MAWCECVYICSYEAQGFACLFLLVFRLYGFSHSPSAGTSRKEGFCVFIYSYYCNLLFLLLFCIRCEHSALLLCIQNRLYGIHLLGVIFMFHLSLKHVFFTMCCIRLCASHFTKNFISFSKHKIEKICVHWNSIGISFGEWSECGLNKWVF